MFMLARSDAGVGRGGSLRVLHQAESGGPGLVGVEDAGVALGVQSVDAAVDPCRRLVCTIQSRSSPAVADPPLPGGVRSTLLAAALLPIKPVDYIFTHTDLVQIWLAYAGAAVQSPAAFCVFS